MAGDKDWDGYIGEFPTGENGLMVPEKRRFHNLTGFRMQKKEVVNWLRRKSSGRHNYEL
jgi:hypothetical protein